MTRRRQTSDLTAPPRLATAAWLVVGVVLAIACAPVTEPPRVDVRQLAAAPSFYPQETGLRWVYLREGARLDDPRQRAEETVEGPAVLDGELWIAFRLVGGGRVNTHYRQFRADGVYLKRQTRAGGLTTFEPPIRELPAEGELRIGARWSGTSVARGSFPGAAVEQRSFTYEIAYDYWVVDRRTVNVSDREYDVFVISRTWQWFGEEGELQHEATTEHWFAPRVGWVRRGGKWPDFLVETNFEAGRPVP